MLNYISPFVIFYSNFSVAAFAQARFTINAKINVLY